MWLPPRSHLAKPLLRRPLSAMTSFSLHQPLLGQLSPHRRPRRESESITCTLSATASCRALRCSATLGDATSSRRPVVGGVDIHAPAYEDRRPHIPRRPSVRPPSKPSRRNTPYTYGLHYTAWRVPTTTRTLPLRYGSLSESRHYIRLVVLAQHLVHVRRRRRGTVHPSDLRLPLSAQLVTLTCCPFPSIP